MCLNDILNEIDDHWDAPARERHPLHMQLIENLNNEVHCFSATHPLLKFFDEVDAL